MLPSRSLSTTPLQQSVQQKPRQLSGRVVVSANEDGKAEATLPCRVFHRAATVESRVCEVFHEMASLPTRLLLQVKPPNFVGSYHLRSSTKNLLVFSCSEHGVGCDHIYFHCSPGGRDELLLIFCSKQFTNWTNSPIVW